MFESLSDRLGGVFDRLRGRGALTEADVRTAMREVRVALLEADVALPVARQFVDKATEQAIGQNVLRSVTPRPAGHQDRQRRAGRDAGPRTNRPCCSTSRRRVVMMVGLQGSARRRPRQDRQALVAGHAGESRPQEGADGGRSTSHARGAGTARDARHPVRGDTLRSSPASSRWRYRRAARDAGGEAQGFDVLMLDTAPDRLHVDQALMDEMKAVADMRSRRKSCCWSMR